MVNTFRYCYDTFLGILNVLPNPILQFLYLCLGLWLVGIIIHLLMRSK